VNFDARAREEQMKPFFQEAFNEEQAVPGPAGE
jgi:hypothetical protein